MLLDYIQILTQGDPSSVKIYSILLPLYIIAILFTLSVHETAHGFIARKCGDSTAYNLGRLTLNPLKHIDPVGFICMLVAGFGWAKPVPVNSRNFRKPRRDMALVAFAGPASNLIMALFFAIIAVLANPLINKLILLSYENQFLTYLVFALAMFIQILVSMNITLAVFNLLPIPPLDGSKILYTFLPPKLYFKIAPYERYISLVLMILLITGIVSPLISTVSDFIYDTMFTGVSFVVNSIKNLF
jgi:Zn-dependent protease